MSYENDLVEALGLAPPALTAAAAVQTAWARLQNAITAWNEMAAISSQGMGSGPTISMYEGALAQTVSIHLRVYKNALTTAELAPDPLQSRRPIGSGLDFSTREVPF